MDDLKFQKLRADDPDFAAKMDALLSRMIGADSFTVKRTTLISGKRVWDIFVWLTDEEYDRFNEYLKQDSDQNWDREYEKLLDMFKY